MAEAKVTLQPGVNTLATATLNNASWSSCNLIRFQTGYLQNVGGWESLNDTDDPIIGTARSLHAWQDLLSNKLLAIGTNERLQLFFAGNIYDITPVIATNDLTNALSVTQDSSIVSVEDAGNGAVVGDWIYLAVLMAIGDIVIPVDFYQVVEIIDVDNYTFDCGIDALATSASDGDTPFFTTVMSDATVSVLLLNHGYVVNDIFTVTISTIVGGLTLAGEYIVATVADTDNFTFEAVSAAGSNDTGYENGDQAQIQYLLASGPVFDEQVTGWGGGGWGLGGWGESPEDVFTINPARIWSLDNFGEDLLANPTNEALYAWPPAFGTVAAIVATAPSNNIGMFVAMPQAQVIVYGAETGSNQDPLLIRWSDTGDYTNFTPAAGNQAGSVRLSRGSRIVGGMQAAQTALIWTNTDLWSLAYQGLPFIYSITTLAQNCGLIAQNAWATLARNVYWMSDNGFFTLRGNSVAVLPCTVWDEVFAKMHHETQTICMAGSNTAFNEVWFFYPQHTSAAHTGEINSYAKVNLENPDAPIWDYGSLIRTAWIDQSAIGASSLNTAIAVKGDLLYQHEVGYTDDGIPMADVFAQSGYADIQQGQDFPFVDQIIPDFRFYDAAATAQFSVYGTNYPFEDPAVFGPFDVTTATTLISMRARRRQIAFRIDFDGQSFVRLGAVRYRVAPSGRSAGVA